MIKTYSSEQYPKAWEELETLLERVHPKMQESFYFAAVPLWYDVPLFTAIRNEDEDDLSERLVTERLSWYSFVIHLDDAPNDETYMLHRIERSLLNIHAIEHDPQLYREAHKRAFVYWETNETVDGTIRDSSYIYHALFNDLEPGVRELIRLFRVYENERHLAGLEQLIDRAHEASYFIQLLDGEERTAELDALLLYMEARLCQLLGNWPESVDTLDRINTNDHPRLKPYVTTAYGHAAAKDPQRRDHATAINKYGEALKQFDELPEVPIDPETVKADRARTTLELGSAHVGLADRAQSDERKITSFNWKKLLTDVYRLVLSLPLFIFLWNSLGRHVFKPRFWSIFGELDWAVARFFTKGAKFLRKADYVLEDEALAEAEAADQQLAFLHLRLGDAEGARKQFDQLLSNPLNNLYQQAVLQVGLGEALLMLGELGAARQTLTIAHPVLRQYKDRDLEVKALHLLGEVLARSGRPDDALQHFKGALDEYQDSQPEAATRIVTELDKMVAQGRLTPQGNEDAKALSDNVTTRRYPVRYRDIMTRLLRGYSIVSFFVFTFVFSVLAVRLAERSVGELHIEHTFSPLLSTNPSIQATVRQGLPQLSLETLNEPDVLIQIAVLGVFLYLVMSIVAGLIAIVRANPDRLQNAQQENAIEINEEFVLQGGRMGEDNQRHHIPFDRINHVLIADSYLLSGELNRDSSMTVLESQGDPNKPIIIYGNTAQYQTVRQQILKYAPPTVRITDISFSILQSKMGVFFIATLLMMFGVTILSKIDPLRELLSASLFGAYSIADLHAYLFLGFFIPPIWWFIIQPLRVNRALHRYTYIDLVGPIGFVLATVLLLTNFSPIITTPNLYLPVLALICSGLVVWSVLDFYTSRVSLRHQSRNRYTSQLDKLIERPLMRVTVTLIMLFGFVLVVRMVGSYVAREVRTYHHIVRATEYVRRIEEMDEQGVKGTTSEYLLKGAVDHFGRAIETAEREVLKKWSPQADSNLYANFGAVQFKLANLSDSEIVQNEQYEDAVKNFEVAFDVGNNQGIVNGDYDLWSGFAYQAQNDYRNALMRYGYAIENYQKMLSNTDDDDSDTVDQINLNIVTAMISQGKGYYQIGEYDEAADKFEQALMYLRDVKADDLKSQRMAAEYDSMMGLGYVHYANREYDEAEMSWLDAQQSAQGANEAIPLSNLGTLYWRRGTRDENIISRSDCVEDDETAEEENKRIEPLLEQSIDYFQQSLAIEGQDKADKAFTHRTTAAVYYLLRNCPDHNKYATLFLSFEQFKLAAEAEPENADYWYWAGRGAYAAWRSLPNKGPQARDILFEGFGYLQDAVDIDSVDTGDYVPTKWLTETYLPSIKGTLEKGDEFVETQDGWSRGYYDFVANMPLDHIPRTVKDEYELVRMRGRFKYGWISAIRGEDAAAQQYTQLALADFAQKGDSDQFVLAAVNAQLDIQDFDAESPLLRLFNEVNLPYTMVMDDIMIRGQEKIKAGEYTHAIHAFDLVANELETNPNNQPMLQTIIDSQNSLQQKLDETPTPAGNELFSHLDAIINRTLDEADTDVGSKTDVKDAMDWGMSALRFGRSNIAAKWFNEAVERASLEATLTDVRSYRPNLRAVWEETPPDSGALLYHLNGQFSTQLQNSDATLNKNRRLWRYRAWFKYYVGQAAFLAGDETVAKNALMFAQIDADQAKRLGDSGGVGVDTYISEGAWGWYHIVRGDEQFEDGAYADAAATYALAAEAFAPDQNGTAKEEATEAAFKASLAALANGDGDAAEQWAREGLARMEQFGTADADNVKNVINQIRDWEIAADDDALQETKTVIMSLLTATDKE